MIRSCDSQKSITSGLLAIRPFRIRAGLSQGRPGGFFKTAMQIQNDITRPLFERIMCRVIKAESGCWIWTGSAVKCGNGIRRARMKNQGKQVFVYRLMFEIEYGATLPSWLLACHSCDNGLCVNPEHIFLGSVKDNTSDMISKGRAYFQKRPEAFAKERASVNYARIYKNKNGCRGVYRNHNRFTARITINKQSVNLGTFDTAETASKAYLATLSAIRAKGGE